MDLGTEGDGIWWFIPTPTNLNLFIGSQSSVLRPRRWWRGRGRGRGRKAKWYPDQVSSKGETIGLGS